MNIKTKIIIISISLVVSYAFGRWSAPEKVKIETKIVEVETKHKDQVKTIVVAPDGTKTEIIHTVVDTEKNKDIDNVKETIKSNSRVRISALAGVHTRDGLGSDFGGSISTNFLGPISIGAYGLQSGSFGISLGLDL